MTTAGFLFEEGFSLEQRGLRDNLFLVLVDFAKAEQPREGNPFEDLSLEGYWDDLTGCLDLTVRTLSDVYIFSKTIKDLNLYGRMGPSEPIFLQGYREIDGEVDSDKRAMLTIFINDVKASGGAHLGVPWKYDFDCQLEIEISS